MQMSFLLNLTLRVIAIIAKNININYEHGNIYNNILLLPLGHISNSYNTTPPTRDLVPRSRMIRGREKRDNDLQHHQQELCSMSTSRFGRETFRRDTIS